MEKIKSFYLELIKDDEFKAKLAQFRQKNGDDYEKIIEKVILPEAKKRGYNFTKEELLTYENESGENGLSDEELLDVAGGFGKNQMVALSLGAIMGLSAIGAATSNLFGGQNTENQSVFAPKPDTSTSQMADVETPNKTLDKKEQKNQENSIGNVGSRSQIGQLKGNTIEETQKATEVAQESKNEKGTEQTAPVVQAEKVEEETQVIQAEKNEKQVQLWLYKNTVKKAGIAKENYNKVCREAENLDGKNLQELTDKLSNAKKGLEEAKVELNKAKESLKSKALVRHADKKVLEINRLLNVIDEGIENSTKLLTRIELKQNH